jgi:tellurite resistance protein
LEGGEREKLMSAIGKSLSQEVYVALAAVGWADGELSPPEADAIVRAAVEDGLELDEIERIEAATKEPVSLRVLDGSNLSLSERKFIYGVAAWIARIDGKVSLDEFAALHSLGSRLALNKAQQHQLNALVDEVAQGSDVTRAERFDLAALRRLTDDGS